jgi:hypothetical protein
MISHSVTPLSHPSSTFRNRIRHLSLMFLFCSSARILLLARVNVLTHPLILLVLVLAFLLPSIFV